ncbi:MAG: GGDEF domain-containing protein [Caldimonas sp.]|uniref:GGDEF domain-containing protein n=1 Tax=Caldimonas sp. TaxID=2838790 RepID=UPI00391AB777
MARWIVTPTPSMPEPYQPVPPWLAWLQRTVLALGLARATVALVILVWLTALMVTFVVLRVSGQGSLALGWRIATVCVWLIGPVVGYAMLRMFFELERARRRVALLAVTDELTGCYNRRHFMERAEVELLRSRRHGLDMALVLIDADGFKQVNDTYGHQCGDELLRQMALRCRASLRGTDVLARFGGEELVLLLPQTDLAGAMAIAERIRKQVQALSLDWRGQTITLTVSLGVAALRCHPDIDALIRDADHALYEAKRAGRNRVHGAREQGGPPGFALAGAAPQA